MTGNTVIRGIRLGMGKRISGGGIEDRLFSEGTGLIRAVGILRTTSILGVV